jgi:hypothetical protein
MNVACVYFVAPSGSTLFEAFSNPLGWTAEEKGASREYP